MRPTSWSIIGKIVAGEHDPVELAKLCNSKCCSSEEIAKRLSGDYCPEYLFALWQVLELYDFYSTQIKEFDVQVGCQEYERRVPERGCFFEAQSYQPWLYPNPSNCLILCQFLSRQRRMQSIRATKNLLFFGEKTKCFTEFNSSFHSRVVSDLTKGSA